MSRVSFVIPSYRSKQTLDRTLESIFSQQTHCAYEVVVVDSSGDDLPERIQSRFPQVRMVTSKVRLSPGAARNRGVEVSRGELLAFVDADAVLHPRWLEKLRAELSQPQTQLVGGYVRNANPHTAASRVLHWIEFSQYLPGRSRFLPVISSSNLLLSRDVFEAAGGFDPSWEMAEDLLFCRRLGWGIRFCGNAGVEHQHRDQWSAVASHLDHLGYWSGRSRAAGLMRGSWLRRCRPAAWLLLPWRTSQILLRVFRSNTREGYRCLGDFPLLLQGLSCWLTGFRRGLRE